MARKYKPQCPYYTLHRSGHIPWECRTKPTQEVEASRNLGYTVEVIRAQLGASTHNLKLGYPVQTSHLLPDRNAYGASELWHIILTHRPM